MRTDSKKNVFEKRSYAFEVRNIDDTGDNIVIEGHAAVFDTPSDAGGLAWFEESITKGAFKQAIKEDDVRALFNHDSNYVLGRNKAGTLELKEDNEGLAVKISAPKTTWAIDLATSMKRGDIDQMSFGFLPRGDEGEEWDFEAAPKPTRKLLDLRLFDVSVVTYPFYEETAATVRSKEAFEKHVKGLTDAEKEKSKIKLENLRRKLELKQKEV